MKLKDQEVLYAYLEGRHCADDDERDNGGFYIKMTQELGRNPKLWNAFTDGYVERMRQNGTPSHFDR